MKQEMEDTPRTKQEYERQKGPIPLIAIILCLAFIIVFILFFGPAFWLQLKSG